MFGKAADGTILPQASYKRYLDKNVRVTKGFDTGDMVFFDRPKHKPKTAKEPDEQIAKSKFLTKSICAFQVIRAYQVLLIVDQVDAKLAVSIDRCSKSPA